uniref:Uncharacterized protein n=1 Tax=Rhizophora mucronata TaxID=61149 RepID=A0A2P2N9Z2_RHIMU
MSLYLASPLTSPFPQISEWPPCQDHAEPRQISLCSTRRHLACYPKVQKPVSQPSNCHILSTCQ